MNRLLYNRRFIFGGLAVGSISYFYVYPLFRMDYRVESYVWAKYGLRPATRKDLRIMRGRSEYGDPPAAKVMDTIYFTQNIDPESCLSPGLNRCKDHRLHSVSLPSPYWWRRMRYGPTIVIMKIPIEAKYSVTDDNQTVLTDQLEVIKFLH